MAPGDGFSAGRVAGHAPTADVGHDMTLIRKPDSKGWVRALPSSSAGVAFIARWPALFPAPCIDVKRGPETRKLIGKALRAGLRLQVGLRRLESTTTSTAATRREAR